MVDLVNSPILNERKVSKQGIFEELGVSVSTADKIVHDYFAFSKFIRG